MSETNGISKVLIVSPVKGNGKAIAGRLDGCENIECFYSAKIDEAYKRKWWLEEGSLILLDAEVDGTKGFPPESVNKVPASLILFFNVSSDLDIEKRALRGGYKGVFLKEDSLDQIEKGIRSVLNGSLWYSRQILQDLIIEQLLSGYDDGENNLNVLTPREEEILLLVASGASNKEIARDLFLSPHTIRGHMSSIFGKIGVENRLQATLWASKYLDSVKMRLSKIV